MSVIIPVYDEAENIQAVIRSLKNIQGTKPHEIIVVDGDKNGGTIQAIRDDSVKRLIAPKSRGTQMNHGAAQASGDVLLFLHADTFLPPHAFDKIVSALTDETYVGGAFRYAIKTPHLFLKSVYITSYWRALINRVPYGDMAIFIRRRYFQKIGGYRDIPIMEDVALMQTIKKNKDKITFIKDGVHTSTRRYREEGIYRGWLRNHKLRILYTLGVPPEKLVKYYPDTRRKPN